MLKVEKLFVIISYNTNWQRASISPDNQWVAYVDHGSEPESRSCLRIAAVDGSGDRILYPNEETSLAIRLDTHPRLGRLRVVPGPGGNPLLRWHTTETARGQSHAWPGLAGKNFVTRWHRRNLSVVWTADLCFLVAVHEKMRR